jgi:hypothetical protein
MSGLENINEVLNVTFTSVMSREHDGIFDSISR